MCLDTGNCPSVQGKALALNPVSLSLWYPLQSHAYISSSVTTCWRPDPPYAPFPFRQVLLGPHPRTSTLVLVRCSCSLTPSMGPLKRYRGLGGSQTVQRRGDWLPTMFAAVPFLDHPWGPVVSTARDACRRHAAPTVACDLRSPSKRSKVTFWRGQEPLAPERKK